jgi:hypothetical protein
MGFVQCTVLMLCVFCDELLTSLFAHIDLRLARRYLHDDRVFLPIINQVNTLFGSLHAIRYHAHLSIRGTGLQDRDVVHGVSVAVVHLELRPICRDAWSDREPVDFQPEPKE